MQCSSMLHTNKFTMRRSHNGQDQFILSMVTLAQRPCTRSGMLPWKAGPGRNLFTLGMPPSIRPRRLAELSSAQT